jgi:hypothetical protein
MKMTKGRLLNIGLGSDDCYYADIRFKDANTGETISGCFNLGFWLKAPNAQELAMHKALMNPIVALGGKQKKPAQSRPKKAKTP